MTTVTTYDVVTLLPNLRAYLAAQGIVRVPRDAGTLPPMWLDPRKGTPYPGQKEGLNDPVESGPDLVLALYPETGIVSQPYEGFLVRKGVTIFYRARKSPMIQTIHEQIRTVLHDKRDYNLNGLEVNESMLFRELQRLGADEEGYSYNCEYMFTLWGPD